MTQIGTRFAPSNTGGCHLGSIRTALYNYILAKQKGGKFFLRVEDTDLKRCSDESEAHIYESLKWLGIMPEISPLTPDENGPYKQSQRDYTKYVQTLLDNGMAYYAFDTPAELETARQRWDLAKVKGGYGPMTRQTMNNSLVLPADQVADKVANEDYVIRFKLPTDRIVRFEDGVLGWIAINTSELDDKILMKSGGKVAYHLANVCDDHDMGTTHVLRGNEWVTSTPLHVLLYEAMGWTPPTFYHLPLILDKDGRKFSKRTAIKLGISVFALNWTGLDDDSGEMKTILGFKELGYEASALLNYLCLLGWHPSGNDEIFSLDELVANFSLDRINTSGAKFDKDKLDHINSVWVKRIPLAEIVEMYPLLKKYSLAEQTKIVDLAKERAVFRTDLGNIIEIFTHEIDSYLDVKKLDGVFVNIGHLWTKDNSTVDWSAEKIKQSIYDLCLTQEIKMGKFLPGLRQALTGGISGPDLNTTMEILGPVETNKRIVTAIEKSQLKGEVNI